MQRIKSLIRHDIGPMHGRDAALRSRRHQPAESNRHLTFP
jgi:hypothetical protein